MTEPDYLNYIVINDPKTAPNKTSRQNSVTFHAFLIENASAYDEYRNSVKGMKGMFDKQNKWIEKVRSILLSIHCKPRNCCHLTNLCHLRTSLLPAV